MNSFVFLFVFIFSLSSQAMQCVDLFKVEQTSSYSNSLRPKILQELPEDFTQMNIYERLEVLDYAVVTLNNLIKKNPKPGLLQRFFSDQGDKQHQDYTELNNLRLEVIAIKENYQLVMSLLHGTVKSHNLSKSDEIQLLNRLLEDTSILDALKFLNQRQIRLNGRDRLEQYFIDSVVVYLAWGPHPKLFPVPINNWLIFDIFLGHKDAKYMINMTFRFKNAAKMYKDAKEGLNRADALIEDYSLSRQDPVFEIIEKTEKKNPGVIERLLDQEINNGHVIFDEKSGVLDIVDDSL